jgi:hypothetical protein
MVNACGAELRRPPGFERECPGSRCNWHGRTDGVPMSTPGFTAELALARSRHTYVTLSGRFAAEGAIAGNAQVDSSIGASEAGVVIPAISCAGVSCADGASKYCCSGCHWGSYQADYCNPYGSGRRQWSSVLWGIPWFQSWEKTCRCTPGQPPGEANPRLPDRCVNTGVNIWGQWDVLDGTCCASGTALCGTACVNLNTDPGNCGACGYVCASGACCNGVCVNLTSDNNNCGACGNVCHGGKYCAGGSCVCPPGLVDCSGTCCSPNACCGGACRDLSGDPANCGSCGHVCTGLHTCQNGVCACPPDKPTDCSGTCTNLANDYWNCGACGSRCSPDRTCQSGTCVCSPGTTDCSGICKDLNYDYQNCGACNHVCVLPNGICCGGQCKNIASDPQNCGGCNVVCPSGQVCCGGKCTNVSSDPQNCGHCGNVCPSCSGTGSCTNGVCAPLTAYTFLVEALPSMCALGTYTVSAWSESDATNCAQRAYPPASYSVGTQWGYYNYVIDCPNAACRDILGVAALSESDGQSCVQNNNGGCDVASGTC